MKRLLVTRRTRVATDAFVVKWLDPNPEGRSGVRSHLQGGGSAARRRDAMPDDDLKPDIPLPEPPAREFGTVFRTARPPAKPPGPSAAWAKIRIGRALRGWWTRACCPTYRPEWGGNEWLSRSGDILVRVRDQTQDAEPGVRWIDEELLRWIDDGQRAVANRVPGATAKDGRPLSLEEGSRQMIPDGGERLLFVVANGDEDDGRQPERHTPGRPRNGQHQYIRTGSADASPADGQFSYYMHDEDDPQAFYIYPGARAADADSVSLVYSATPVSVFSSFGLRTDEVDDARRLHGARFDRFAVRRPPRSATSEAGRRRKRTRIDVPDIYGNAILDYVLHRAYSKQASFNANNAQTCPQRHLQQFELATQHKRAVDMQLSPRLDANVTEHRGE